MVGIEYITIASTGNGTDFGELIVASRECMGASTQTRAVAMGGDTDETHINTIAFISISSGGKAEDFGDISKKLNRGAGCSDSHGGLGGY